MKIVFPHIPKCAGSSVQKQLKARDDVYLDYFNNPLCVHEADRAAGQAEQQALQGKVASTESWIVFGHFACSAYNELPYDRLIVLLRNPLERAVSHFYFIKDTLIDDEVHRRGYPEVGLIKDGKMSLDEYLELDHVRFFYSDYYLKDVILDDRITVFPVEQLKTAYRNIAKLTDIRLDAGVWTNRGKYRSDCEQHRSNFARDEELYRKLIEHTERQRRSDRTQGGIFHRMAARLLKD